MMLGPSKEPAAIADEASTPLSALALPVKLHPAQVWVAMQTVLLRHPDLPSSSADFCCRQECKPKCLFKCLLPIHWAGRRHATVRLPAALPCSVHEQSAPAIGHDQ